MLLSKLKNWLQKKKPTATYSNILTFQSTIFNDDQLKQYAIDLALSHQLNNRQTNRILFKKLADYEKTLNDVYQKLNIKELPEDRTSATEWLLDNFYLIKEQIQIVRINLPKNYYKKLPQLTKSFSEVPRIYDIAAQIIAHEDGKCDLNILNIFIPSYQTVSVLTLGELWSIPLMLAIALIENIVCVSKEIVLDKEARQSANVWADRMVEMSVTEPEHLITIIAKMTRTQNMNSTFLVELVRRLQIAVLSLPLSWIEQHLTDEGLSTEILVQQQAKKQALMQATMSNSINSLRRLEIIEWRKFVESMSIVNQVLARDPANIYNKMDFKTRDLYRHVVENLALDAALSEKEVATHAVSLAEHSASQIENKKNHVGYYLIDNGLTDLQNRLGIRNTFFRKIINLNYDLMLVCYFGSMFALVFILLVVLMFCASRDDLTLSSISLLGILIVLIVSKPCKDLVDLIVTLLVKPKALPRMDFEEELPKECRTLVVVLGMLNNMSEVETLLKTLEVYFLGNRDRYLHFMLLTDFNDALQENMPEDEALLYFAKEKIYNLNQHYSSQGNNIFYFCHRKREWNESEQTWMGRERKRGKLSDLNELICLGKNNFSFIVGDSEILRSVIYVITLDTDTALPRESARQLVAVMAHPLNKPILDNKQKVIVEGYGILQPRIAEVLSETTPNFYVRLYTNEFGIDPYTRTVSNVYQDLFKEGSFIGKGIYEVQSFNQVLGNRFLDNRILSHDLLEGCYLHSGYLSDIPLFEKSPINYLADIKRRIRWIRGDWQLIGWLLPRVKNKTNKLESNPLSFLSKMKILDNLRRSLIPVALMVFLFLTFTTLTHVLFWFAIVMVTIFTPFLTQILITFGHKIQLLYTKKFDYTNYSLIRHFQQNMLYLACLPHEAWYSSRAILSTLWRMSVSNKHLLEWVPSDQVAQSLKNSKIYWMLEMWINPVIAVLSIVILLLGNKINYLFILLPLFVLWFIAPLLMRSISQIKKRKIHNLTEAELRFLHKMARKTWHYFETFITVQDNWLPPDNYQEIPVDVVAKRTSPTNIGFALLANLTAHDFGYLTSDQLLERTKNTLQTLSQLETYHGHFYNWYDTETLSPLLPRYISTVDSGNLAGYLLVLRQGLLALSDEPILTMRYLDGLQDTLAVLLDLTDLQQLHSFKKLLQDSRSLFNEWSTALKTTHDLYDAGKKMISFSLPATPNSDEISKWLNLLFMQCHDLNKEIKLFARIPHLSFMATLREISEIVTTDPHEQEAVIEARRRIALAHQLAHQAYLLSKMDISFLHYKTSHLLTIGFNVDEKRTDAASYDLLSSEARFGIFVAIAQGQLLQESWFSLSRLLIANGNEPLLISWSGSMFEYLMPLLVMPTYPFTLLDQTYHAIVKRQIIYGKQCGVPWGISESGFNMVDSQSNYLYRAFGVPGLGLKRGLEEELVITPYASAMALMIDPKAACKNLQRLAAEFFTGKYGFYEAIDYTPSRLVGGQKRKIVCSFMTHHQGMILLSISYLLHQKPMQKRFIADPLFQSTLLLLQESTPKTTYAHLELPKTTFEQNTNNVLTTSKRVFNTADTIIPQTQLLSNGRYHVVISQAGGGYSRFKDIMLTRWHEDSTCDNWGMFCYLRDLESKKFSSIPYQPVGDNSKNYKAIFTSSHVVFSQEVLHLDSHLEIVVSQEDDFELRRIKIHNRTKNRRQLELTSYAEIVLSNQMADLAHPVFNKLFIETEIISSQQSILARRRTSSENQNALYYFNLLNIDHKKPYHLSYETDRSKFVGRNCSLMAPEAMQYSRELSNTDGSVLDPIAAIRCRFVLDPDELIVFDLITGVAETKEKTLALIEKYRVKRIVTRIFGLALTHDQVLLHHLNMNESDAQMYERMASSLIYANPLRRADQNVLLNNRLGQSSLWSYAISGDLPIILLHIKNINNIELVRQLIQAQAYWKFKGLEVDLIIINNEHTNYLQLLQELIVNLISTSQSSAGEHICKIVVRLADQIPKSDLILLESVARLVINDQRGTLREQVYRRRIKKEVRHFKPIKKIRHYEPFLLESITHLNFFNGLGGFTHDGSEYIIHLKERNNLPLPWSNVLTNSNFGSLISDSGQAYTWFLNSHEFRLTPWENDPLRDLSEELFYLRDDETGLIWSPTALPCRGTGDYRIRHGFGYSIFEHAEDGIHTELCITVAQDAAIKLSSLTISNRSQQSRKLSTTGFIAWVLGDLRIKNMMHVITDVTTEGAILAQNYYNTDFKECTGFFNALTSENGLLMRSFTCDRTEFLGRNGSYQAPRALRNTFLSNKSGAGLDPCAAIQLSYTLAPGETRNIVFMLGAAQSKQEASTLLTRFNNSNLARETFISVRQFWQKSLRRTRFETPDPALNFLTNGWLPYQVLASRLWARTGYYQSSGAFGFRDQLQDAMSLVKMAPQLFRSHLLLCASRQFEEGDVQHWWHPPQGRGVRTRCSDDYLWLPFALSYYIDTTGDQAILMEHIPFLHGRLLSNNEESYYELPTIGTESFSLYEHARRAIQYGLHFGVHDLPLMGSGDWNDGMNLVGIKGKGESVWLGFFLYSVLMQFGPIAKKFNDEHFALVCEQEAVKLKQALNTHGWDGEWYLRAYFDDGQVLGSHMNTECQIDAISQSWSVISKAGDPLLIIGAMTSLKQDLVDEKYNLIKLLTPPFNKMKPSPGYIEDYVAGIRENGGQYTHAAVWVVLAFAMLGDKKTAWKLLNMINPIQHGSTVEKVERYRIEPYVTAGDVYSVSPHSGRGGWSWYTGSAGWLFRVITETLLGFQIEEGKYLRLQPLIPDDWNQFKIEYDYHNTHYDIFIERVSEKRNSLLDDHPISDDRILLQDDENNHTIHYFIF